MTELSKQNSDRRWDLASIFPALDSEAYEHYLAAFEKKNDALAASALSLGKIRDGGRALWVRGLLDLEALELEQAQLINYVSCLRADDPANATVTAANIRLHEIFGSLKSVRAMVAQKLGQLNDSEFADLEATDELAGARHRVRLLRREARTTLLPREEKLVAELDADGQRRWARLAADTLAEATFDLEMPAGTIETVSMSRRFELASDPRSIVRRRAFDAINRTFAPKAKLLATCLNAMSGAGITLARWRGMDPIEETLIDNWILPSTVQTMQNTLKEHAPLLQNYLRRKARLLGLETVGVFDRSAQLDVAELNVHTIEEGTTRIVSAFDKYLPDLADYSRRVIANHWIESEMRAGKQPGGFCATFPASKETRIFVSFAGSFHALAMIAHELGHAYHAEKNFDSRYWQQNAPSSLSETASILCEHFLRRAVFSVDELPNHIRMGALCAQLDSAVNYLLRIPRDFDFEVEFYRERTQGEVTVERLCELMRSAHASWFGSALQGDDGDRLAWAYNHIFMEPSYRVYNFPYSFGYLLSSRIADAFVEQGSAFTPTYVAFLRASASMPIEEAVSETLGFDVTRREFWDSALAGVRGQLDLLAQLES